MYTAVRIFTLEEIFRFYTLDVYRDDSKTSRYSDMHVLICLLRI